MIDSHHQISAPTVIGLATTCSTAAALATTPSGRKAVSTLGRLAYNQPSLLAGYAAGCLEGIRTQGLNAVSYFIPSAKALAGREITVGILGSITGRAEIKAAGRISLGALGWVAVTPVFQLVKTFMNACHRSIESGQQNQLIEMMRNKATFGALELGKRSLERDAEHYKALSERSVIPGWKSLLLTTVPTVLLAPELGIRRWQPEPLRVQPRLPVMHGINGQTAVCTLVRMSV